MTDNALTALTPHCAQAAPEATPDVVARLLDIVADHNVDHTLRDVEQMIARLRAEAEKAEVARGMLRDAPTDVLRQALRLRASRNGVSR